MAEVSLDDIIKVITETVISTETSVSQIIQNLGAEFPDIVQQLIKETQNEGTKLEGVSLLSLKNNSMLSYINNLVLFMLSRVDQMQNKDHKDEFRDDIVKNTIVQRVTLERGIKSLEKRLSYQLDKMVRAYARMENEAKSNEKEEQDGDEEDEESDSDEDQLSYKPDAQSLVKNIKPEKKGSKLSSSVGSDPTSTNEKYKPPRIAAVVPPTTTNFTEASNKSSQNKRKLQSMEEYLMETGDKPMLETSIGSNIVTNGRGGTKTTRELAKEKEIQNYEESNFTRLSTNMSKKDSKQKRREQNNKFFGEDWSIFNNKRDGSDIYKRKKTSAWDKAKRNSK